MPHASGSNEMQRLTRLRGKKTRRASIHSTSLSKTLNYGFMRLLHVLLGGAAIASTTAKATNDSLAELFYDKPFFLPGCEERRQ
jgi:hypothetical protein